MVRVAAIQASLAAWRSRTVSPTPVDFEDDGAPDRIDRRVFANLDDAVGAAGGCTENLEESDHAGHGKGFTIQSAAACYQSIGIADRVAHGGDAGVGSEWLAFAATQPGRGADFER